MDPALLSQLLQGYSNGNPSNVTQQQQQPSYNNQELYDPAIVYDPQQPRYT